MARIKKTLRYPANLTSETLAEANGRYLRKLYRRLFNRMPVTAIVTNIAGAPLLKVFETSATEPFVRELEFQAAMRTEIEPALLAQALHNPSGRPIGSKTKNRRNPLSPKTKYQKQPNANGAVGSRKA
jgi:hypothetical protein